MRKYQPLFSSEMSSIDEIIDGAVDIYEFLEVKPSADKAQIRRQYRKKALVYHPDKNGGEDAEHKFQVLATAYEILTNDDLRKKYDDIRQEATKRTVKQELRQRFREELQRAEMGVHRATVPLADLDREFRAQVRREQRVGKLAEEGLRLRRQREVRLRQTTTSGPGKSYVSYRDIDIGPRAYVVRRAMSTEGKHQVFVQWKHKAELKDLVDLEVIGQIMGFFGPVKSVRILDSVGQRYDGAVVEYATSEGSNAAINYDYKSARLWDGSLVRKLASLLRKCEQFNPESGP